MEPRQSSCSIVENVVCNSLMVSSFSAKNCANFEQTIDRYSMANKRAANDDVCDLFCCCGARYEINNFIITCTINIDAV
ncbi:hypothetical protein DERF_006234 [Dermatophagoides farinae]|uniref:Uncharacterized protein n=1 Tax=Dermatophagoides farinae TaxID=6954 RepID=A0A922L7Y8_DERFA|nr:hypothetical protein DERF_006234 [Dermatophagoides farinae]